MSFIRAFPFLNELRLNWSGFSHHVTRTMYPTAPKRNTINIPTGLRNQSSDARLINDKNPIVSKDTVLFRNENTGYFKVMNLFAVSQFFFWTYLCHFASTTMKDVHISEEIKSNESLPWWKKVNFGQYRFGISIASFLVGWGTMAISWMYTLRSIRYMVLKKGGRELLFITFAPFNRSRYITVPVGKVSAVLSRSAAKAHLPLKIEGTSFHYILDMRGQFTNTRLFDYSTSFQRSWTK